MGKYWNQFDIKIAILVFVAYLFVDGMYVYYTYSVVKKKPFISASTGVLMHFLLAFGVINYVNNYLYIVPLALGSWFGTYIVVAREKTQNK
jgi:hypothetical protein